MKLDLQIRFMCLVALIAAPLAAQPDRNRYVQTNLISDVDGLAAHTDANLSNPWGITYGGTGPWWVNAANTGLSLVYDGTGAAFPASNQLIVSIPSPAQGAPPAPTGIVFNSTPDFGGAVFLFAGATGGLSAWNSGTAAVLKKATPNAVYTGLTLGQLNGANVLYAANFASGNIDVFDTNFNPVALATGAFHDSNLPAGYSPFNVENIGGSIFVMFAKLGDDGDEEKGPGLGYVDEFAPDGTLQMSLEHGDWFNAPWGIVTAPNGFGAASRRLLVGQFGGGQIASFNARTGAFEGLLEGTDGNPVTIEGLWGIRFGNGGTAGSSRELYFAAGIEDEAHGLFGKLSFSGR